MSDLNILSEALNLNAAQIAQLKRNLQTLKSAKLLALDEDVARADSGLHITRAGRDVLAKAVAGKELRFVRVALGDSERDGEIILPTDAELVEFTDLIHQREIDLPMAGVSFTGGGTATVKFQVRNVNLAEGFFCREIGLFALDPDTQAEVLYAYKNYGVCAGWINGGGSAVNLNLIVGLVTVVDEATNVTAVVDIDLLWVSQAEFLEHVNSSNPHPNLPDALTVITENKSTVEEILGVNEADFNHLTSRVSQVEVNVSNVLTQIKSQNHSRLPVSEDFIDCDQCDLFKAKVSSATAGSNVLGVSSLDGIREGLFYTVSDGLRDELVKVNGLVRNGNSLSVVLPDNIQKTFDLTKTYLYRSTGVVVDNHFAGSGDVQASVFDFSSDIWRGESSSTAQTLTLATNLKNAKNFTVTGDGTFADGFFTLS